MDAVTRFPYLLKNTALITIPLDLPKLAEAISLKADHSRETRLSSKFHAQKTPFGRFLVLSSWAIQNSWVYDSHPTLFPLLESLTKESHPEKVRTFLNKRQSQTDHNGFELILRLKSLID